MKFDELNLSPDILSGLRDVQFEKPTPLQESVLPSLLEGKDVFAKAENGKDKNALIGISALQMFSKAENIEGTHVLVLTPKTKEAREIDEQIWAMGYHAEVECAAIHMDGDEEEQKKSVLDKVPILVANPGPLINIMEDNRVIFRHIDYVVVDALDEMVSIGLADRLKAIRKRILSEPQILVLTNEYNNDVKNLAKEFLEKAEIIGFEEVGNNGRALEDPPSISQKLEQGYINVPSRMKITTLMAHIEQTPTDNCVIFTASKRGTDRLYRIFKKRKLKVTSIHGKLSDEKREQRFSNFANGDVQYLLVAEIPAASLDLKNVVQVINYDVPNEADEYRYRANLVGSGKATRIVSLVSKQDRNDISELQNELGQAPQELPLPDKVKQKLKEKKNKKKRDDRKPRPKREGGKKKRGEEKEENKMELPRPSYDKLSGGRTGDTDERTGVVEFFRKLFS